MTDMRATERLLEVIEDQMQILRLGLAEGDRRSAVILEAITELRRRGDTLVRRDDLLRVFQCADAYVEEYEGLESTASDMQPVLERIQTQIGGTL